MGSREKNVNHWIETGYGLFAEEGLEGLNVERLARVASLSKSGFYHHFGDRDEFLKRILDLHLTNAQSMTVELREMRSIDPDLLDILIRRKTSILAHQQLVKNRKNKRCEECLNEVNRLIDPLVIPLWAEFIGLPKSPELAYRYYEVVRDMFYARLTPALFTQEHLRMLVVQEAKRILELLQEVGDQPEVFRARLEGMPAT